MPRRARRRLSARLARAAVVLGVLSCVVGCGGCSPSYVLRSAYEEGRILLARQSIATLLENPELDPETRRQLELVEAVRRFAKDDLGLHVGGAYASFSIVPPGALLHVVSAAERTRLVPYTWWFPIVGDVDYKGYFELEKAEAEAAHLEAEGYDTYVRPSVAFSTLGWFDDPVLSSWLRADPVRIAELLIHELLHRTWYVSGETEFDESLANFVGSVGAIEFFRAHDGPDAPTTQRARAAWSETLLESRQWSQAVAELKALYAASAREHRSLDEILAARAVIFARLQRARAGQEVAPQPTPAATPGAPAAAAAAGVAASATPAIATAGSAAPPPPPLHRRAVAMNNAVILANYAYTRDLGAFDRVYHASGDDLKRAIARLREITKDAKDPFAAVNAAAPPPDTAPADAGASATP